MDDCNSCYITKFEKQNTKRNKNTLTHPLTHPLIPSYYLLYQTPDSSVGAG
jgi:hypothetical protein